MKEVLDVTAGWESVKIKTLADINPKLPFDNVSGELEVSFLPMKLVETEINRIHLTEFKKYNEVKKGYTSMINGDVIFAKITPCMENGKIAVVDSLRNKIAFGSTEFHVLRCKDGLANFYLFYFIVQKRIRWDAQQNMTGAVGQRRVPKKYLEDLKIPLPPFTEQHRIVAKIEELFSSLDKGIETLEAARQQLKVYRQAVLKWAFEGRLTHVNVVDGELLTGWRWKKIEEIIEVLDQGWSPKCINASSVDNTQWAVIKTTAIQPGVFLETENKILPENLEPRKQHELRNGDVLITRAGPKVRVGICCMVKNVRPRLINCDKVYRIKTNTDEVLSNYLAMLLNSPEYSDKINEMKTGISDSGVNLTQKSFLQLKIKLPPIEGQIAIVSEIESRLSVCDKIEETIEQSLKLAESLRQSILKKAFEGKLVPQDPNDEPACVLLERIRAEREKNEANKPQPRRKKVKAHDKR